MPSIGSVFRHITGTHTRPPTEAELMDAAIAAFPPAVGVDDAAYAALFARLTALALRGYREPTPLRLPVSEQERHLVTAELGQIVAGVVRFVRMSYGLKTDPHLQISMHAHDAIEIRVTA